jgi:GT2 family glycosyltransferase
VVVNFRSSELIARNLAGIDWSAAPPSTVVLVDNYSSDSERRSITQLAQRHSWDLVATDANLGFAAGMNRGVERAIEADCTNFLLLNPDVSIGSAALSRLFDFGLTHPKTLVSPRLHLPDGSAWFTNGWLDRRKGLAHAQAGSQQDGPDRWLTGACLLIDRDSWELLGGFDERYFLYWEDVDLSQRLLELGGDLRILTSVSAVHSEGGTQRASGKSSRYCFYMCRNRLLFAAVHLPVRDRFRWLWHAPAYARRVVLADGRRGLLRHPWHVPAALAGTVAGLGTLIASVRWRAPRAVPA